jgi:TRAP-type C4-dicarboxylate transport system permease small subunit
MRLLQKVRAFFDRCIDATALITTIGVVFLLVSVNIEVILRYFTGKAHPWVVELSEYTLLIVTLLGAAWVLRREEHIIIDLLLTRLKPRGRAMMEAINYGISAVLCFIVVWYGALICLDDLRGGAVFYKAIILPKAPIMSVVPIGFFILAVQSLRVAYQYLKRWKAFPKSRIEQNHPGDL